MTDRYTFGDNPRAAYRLTLLASVFEPSSTALLSRTRGLDPSRALDLGCGPGHTTDMLQRALGTAETYGIDASASLVDRARARFAPSCVFLVHDMTTVPFPVPTVDVAYARYVLTHLRDPAAALAACSTAVRPGGLLVLEENCALFSEDPLFAKYYEHVERLQRHYGQDPYPGHRLVEFAEKASWTVRSFEPRRLSLDPHAMAELHTLNIRTWSHDPYALAAFDEAAIAEMTEALDAIAWGDAEAPEVTCIMGQAVLQRAS
jgi:trans-aconitate 2-methyltransferase